jgi:hypothetical protein
MKEMTERARRGLPLYGLSRDSPWVQHAAFRNSRWSQLMFHAFPWYVRLFPGSGICPFGGD